MGLLSDSGAGSVLQEAVKGNEVIVLDMQIKNRVQVFGLDGTFVRRLGCGLPSWGKIIQPQAVAVHGGG